jgi:hypothetical protein
MDAQSEKSVQETLLDTRNVIFSLELGAGASHCGKQELPRMRSCGQVAAPASRFPMPEEEKASPTSAISGLSGSISSASASLAQSLANRLIQRLSTVGSTL